MQASSDSFYTTRIVFVVTAAATAMLVVATHALLRRDITGRRRANQELFVANQRLREGLWAAAEVQESLLPPRTVTASGLKFAWAFEPCEELAGDALNVCPLDDQQISVYLLDVSGHGAAAALLAVSVIHTLAPATGNHRLALGVESPIQPAEVAEELNRRFEFDDSVGRFFTLLYGVIDVHTFEFRYVSAGHPAPVHLPQQGRASLLEVDIGPPVGIGSEYRQRAVHLSPGDRLYLYSDGVTETMNGEGELFGTTRLLKVVEQGRVLDLQGSVDRVLGELQRWRGGARQHDDVSIVAIEAEMDG